MVKTVLERHSGKFGVSSDHVKAVLLDVAGQHSICLNGESLEGYRDTWIGRLAGVRHRLDIEVGEDCFVVSEEVSVSARWHLVFVIPTLVLSSIVLNQKLGFFNQFGFLQAGLALLCGFLIQFWAFSQLRLVSVLAQVTEKSGHRREYSALNFSIVVIGLSFAALGSAYLFALGNAVIFTSFILCFSVSILHLFSILSGGLFCNRFFEPSLEDRLPLFGVSLFLSQLLVIVGGAGVMLVQGFRGSAGFEASTGVYLLVDVLLPVVSLSVVLGLLYFVLYFGVSGFARFVNADFVDADFRLKLIAVVGLSVLSYAVVYTGYRMFVLVFLSGDVSVSVRVSGLLVLLAAGYFPAGILYQTVRYCLGVWRVIRGSRPVELPFETRVCCLEFDSAEGEILYFASAVFTGWDHYIVVSNDLVSDFNDDELEAVVRHEEGHIRNRDTWLSFLVIVVSLLTLVGRNVYYVLLDFRGREFSADSEAASVSSSQAVVSALERFRDYDLVYGFGASGAVASFGGGAAAFKGFHRFFDLFFGDYGVREAHPSISERIEALED